MATITHKRLGSSRPAAATNTTLYTVPALTTTIITCINVTTVTAADDSIRIYFVPSGGSADLTTVAYFDMVVPAGVPFVANIMQTLEAAGTLVVYSTNGNTCFVASGMEVSA